MNHQDKLNYSTELDRTRGHLSENSSRCPIGTISRLKSIDFLLIVNTQWDQMALANEVAPGL